MRSGRKGVFGIAVAPARLFIALWTVLTLLFKARPRRGRGNGVYRYRLTIEVDTPAGARRGSVVREIGWHTMWAPTPEAHAERVWQRGEAAVLDLPNGKTVFLLLDPDPKDTIRAGFYTAYGVERGYGTMLKEANASRSAFVFAPSHVLRTHRLPVPHLVTFDDPARPETVRAVDPDDLCASFGEGYAVRRLTIEVTDDPVTESIGHRLPWLEQVGRDRATLIPVLDPRRPFKDAAPIQEVSPASFSTELYR